MDKKRRRLLMMLVIVGLGSLLVIFDASVEIIIVGTVALGIALLFGLGILKSEDLRSIIPWMKSTLKRKSGGEGKGKTKNNIIDPFAPEASANEMQENPPESEAPGIIKEGGIGARLSTAVKSLKHVGFSRKSPSQSEEQIDAMLDKTISEPVEETGTETEEFPDFEEFDFGDDEADLMADLDSFGEKEDIITDSAIDDILASEGGEGELGISIEDEFPDLPSGSGEDSDNNSLMADNNLEEMGELSELSDINFDDDSVQLDSIDLDDLNMDEETDQEMDETEDVEDIIVEEEKEVDDVSLFADDGAIGDEFVKSSMMQEADSITDDDVMSFGGGGSESGLFDLLKSDTTKKESGIDQSLVRDLKDVHVEAKDLVEELESVLGYLGSRNSAGKKQGDR